MPSFYLKKKNCPCCNRGFEGDNVGHVEEDQPFVFRLYYNVHPDDILKYWTDRLVMDERDLVDQWLNQINKAIFIEKILKNYKKPLTREYYEQEYIKSNRDGFLYCEREVHLKYAVVS